VFGLLTTELKGPELGEEGREGAVMQWFHHQPKKFEEGMRWLLCQWVASLKANREHFNGLCLFAQNNAEGISFEQASFGYFQCPHI
jgi:hypothetical protein